MADPVLTALNKLRRIETNRHCGTCNAYDRLGFGAVCVKFQIFVCSECKSAHQSYSHRCKSVTMSNWNQAEVEALMDANNGGNAHNRATYLARLPHDSPLIPQKGGHPNDFKQFVQAVYNEGRWYNETPTFTNKAPSAPALVKQMSAPPASGGGGGGGLDDLLGLGAPAPVQAKSDWSSFDSAGSSHPAAVAPAEPAWAVPAAQKSPGFGDFIDGFGGGGGDFASSAPAAPPSPGFGEFAGGFGASTPATDAGWTSFDAAPPAAASAGTASALDDAISKLAFTGLDDSPAKPAVARTPSAPASLAALAASQPKPALAPMSATTMTMPVAGAAPMPATLRPAVAPPRPMMAQGGMGMGSSMPGGMAFNGMPQQPMMGGMRPNGAMGSMSAGGLGAVCANAGQTMGSGMVAGMGSGTGCCGMGGPATGASCAPGMLQPAKAPGAVGKDNIMNLYGNAGNGMSAPRMPF